MLQRWIDHFPLEHRTSLVRRMRHEGAGSRKDDRQFEAAFFELLVHEFLTGAGGQVTIEPRIAGRTPDFAVTETLHDGAEYSYVVEATDVDIEAGTDLERDRNELLALDILNDLYAPDFVLHIRTEGKLRSVPRKRELMRPFEKLVNETEYEDLYAACERNAYSLDVLPATTFTHDGWTITGRLMPISPDSRPRKGAFVGMGPAKSGVVDDIGKTKQRLYDKAKRYRDVNNLIIALRTSHRLDRLYEVLFGSIGVAFYAHSNPADTSPLPEPHSRRKLDGFWFNSSGPQNQHVIGVATFYGTYPWSVDKSRAVFFANPYVGEPMPRWTKIIDHAEYSEGSIDIIHGSSPSGLMQDYEIIE